jgi:hypothetical protein
LFYTFSPRCSVTTSVSPKIVVLDLSSLLFVAKFQHFVRAYHGEQDDDADNCTGAGRHVGLDGDVDGDDDETRDPGEALGQVRRQSLLRIVTQPTPKLSQKLPVKALLCLAQNEAPTLSPLSVSIVFHAIEILYRPD